MPLITARPVFPGMGCARAILWGLLLIPTMSRTAVGAEMVGWKIPLEFITSLQSPGVVRLESPPEKSPLFGDKDELWDVSKAVSDPLDSNKTIVHMTHPPMEWVVWNASTGRLVTKSDWRGIWQLYELLLENQPRQCRYQLALYDSQDGRSLPPQDAKPLISWSGLGRDDLKAHSESGNGMIEIGGRFTDANHHPWLDISLTWKAKLPGRAHIFSSVSFFLRSGKPMLIGGDMLNGEGFVAVFTAVSELPDGLPVEDAAWWSNDGKVQRLDVVRRETQRARVGNGWLSSTWVNPSDVHALLEPTDVSNRNSNPLAETPLPKREADSYPLLRVPEDLRQWCSEEAWDMTDVLKRARITFADGAMAGYDPKRCEMFFYSASVEELEKFESLWKWGGIYIPSLINLTLNAPHSSFLVSSGGHRAQLERMSGDKVVKNVTFEPSINDNGLMVDTRVTYESVNSQESNFFETIVTSKSGSPLVIHQPPREAKPWVLTAEIHRGHE